MNITVTIDSIISQIDKERTFPNHSQCSIIYDRIINDELIGSVKHLSCGHTCGVTLWSKSP